SDRFGVADVAKHESMAGVPFERNQVLEVARICELVEVADVDIGATGDDVPHEGRADEAGAARDQDSHATGRSSWLISEIPERTSHQRRHRSQAEARWPFRATPLRHPSDRPWRMPAQGGT